MIKRVIVKKDGNYYQCQPRKLANGGVSWKCGVCLFGRIYPFGNKKNQNDSCKRCGAKLSETVHGSWFNLESYSP